MLADFVEPKPPGFMVGVPPFNSQRLQMIVAIAQADTIERGNPRVIGLADYRVQSKNEGPIACCFLLNEFSYARREKR
jgi:hypothetical protein